MVFKTSKIILKRKSEAVMFQLQWSEVCFGPRRECLASGSATENASAKGRSWSFHRRTHHPASISERKSGHGMPCWLWWIYMIISIFINPKGPKSSASRIQEVYLEMISDIYFVGWSDLFRAVMLLASAVVPWIGFHSRGAKTKMIANAEQKAFCPTLPKEDRCACVAAFEALHDNGPKVITTYNNHRFGGADWISNLENSPF